MGSLARQSRALKRLVQGFGLVAAAGLSAACSDRPPVAPRIAPGHARFSVAPRYARLPDGSPVITLSKVRGVLTDGDGNSVAVEALFEGDSAVLVFDVAFTGSTANYTLDLSEFDKDGVLVFHGSQQITLKPGDNPGVAAPVLVPAGPDVDLKSITVSPHAVTINAGGTTNLSVSGTNNSGQAATPNHVGWTSSNPGIATVDENTGAVTAGQYQGSAWIVARMITGLADSAKISVHAPVGSVAVAPATLQIVRGDSAAVGAELRDAGGNLIDDRAATWSSSDASIATVGANGVVRAIKVGTATITATAEGKTGSAAVTVVSPIDHVDIAPASLSFASLHDAQTVKATVVPRAGASVAGIAITYASSNSAVASVDASGKVTANGNGSATITATAETFTASAAVTVQQVATSLSISPKTSGVNSIGDTRTFTATASDALGNAMAIPFTWTSSDNTIATVDANGVAKAAHEGTATITASVGGKSASATFNVIPVPRSMFIKTDTSAIKVGGATNAHASFADANGNLIAGVTPTWSTTTPSIVSISSDGRVVGLSGGQGNITATSGSLTGTTTITVLSPTGTTGKVLIYGPSMETFGAFFSRAPGKGVTSPIGLSGGRITGPQPNTKPSGVRASSIRASFNVFSGEENEQTLAQKAGLNVTVVDAATWGSMTRSEFAQYSAIVFGDPDCSSDPTGVLGPALANASVWAPLITGRVVLVGTDYVFHQQDGGMLMVQNALKWVAGSSGTGLFASLSCYYYSASANTPVGFLTSLGTFGVVGQFSADADNAVITAPTHPIMAGVTAASLSHWGESIHEMFTAYPTTFQVLATSGDGKPYVIVKP